MGHQMRALGHKAVWETSNTKWLGRDTGINVVVEGFTRGSIDAISDAYHQGARFMFVATEEPTDKGFNHGTQPEMVKRQQIFPEAAKFCEGILHLVPGEHVTRWYSQWAPTAQAELGYAPTLVRRDDFAPTFEYGFYGSLTKRRLRLLKQLANTTMSAKAVKLMVDFKTQVERDKAMREAKVLVQIRKFEEMGLVSSSRCCTALCLGRPIVAEPHELSKPWDEIVRFSKTQDSFIKEALLVKAAWKGVHADQMAKFKEKLSPEFCVGEPLRKIGILEARSAAA